MQHQSDTAPAQPERAHSTIWLYSAAGLSALAGLLHLLVTPEHFEEWIGYGLFFLIAGLAQVFFAVVLLRQPANRNLLLAGIAGNALIVGLWVVTRTLGIPLGPAAGEVEAIGAVDTVSKLAELALIGCLFVLLGQTRQIHPDSERGATHERRQ